MIDQELLNAYADQELSDLQRADVEARLRACPASRAALESIVSLKRWVKTETQAVECQAEWSRCRDRFKKIDEVDRNAVFIRRHGWALAGVVAVAIGVGGWSSRMQSGRSLSSADLAGALFASKVSNETAATHASIDQILKRAGRSLRALKPVAGRRLVLNGEPSDELILRDASGELRLLVLPSTVQLDLMQPVPNTPFTAASLSNNMQCISWNEGELRFLLMAERSVNSLIGTASENFRPGQ